VAGLLLSLFLFQGMHAQGAGPHGGGLSFSLILGKTQMVAGDFISFYEVNQVPYSNWDIYTDINVPGMNSFSGNNLTSMIGVEAKYFITPQIAVRFNGSGAINSSPSRDATPAVVPDQGDEFGPGTFIPGFRMTEGRTLGQFFATLGGDYYFAVGSSRVNPYAGLQFNSAYGLMEIFDGFRGLDNHEEVITTWDTRRGEAWGLGGSLVGGIDYNLAEGLFFGFEIRVASYMYMGKRLFHQPGMEAQEAASYNTSFLAMPMVKLGFSF
jgi:hypothetical protein